MNEPQLATLPTIRHDGWTGEKMAIFCETLAETAVVAEACAAAGMSISGAYAARRRNPRVRRRLGRGADHRSRAARRQAPARARVGSLRLLRFALERAVTANFANFRAANSPKPCGRSSKGT